jgi:acetylglutamate kinase|uniref:Acetylglutamate kinase n=1 Tax=uncultured proteobacterium RedeBAC7D11 TaxID=295350 RepID=Q5UF62_9PROT|nr:predicted acetylglutamate kinase [uncultured proteobacterium RedeBAC7D11]
MSISETNAINISKVLTEALPYIRKFNNKVVVIKYGGNAMENKILQKNFARDLVLMKTVGIHPILIHGGGPQIDFELIKNKIKFEFKDGIRKTTLEMIKIVQKVLDNKINKDISDLIQFWGGKTIRLVGKKNSPIKAIKDSKKNLGEVGLVKSIDKKKIMTPLKAGKIPVISPIGWTSKDEPMNINGDFAACAVAASLKAEKIILLTDISGVRDLEGKKISTMSLKEAKRVLKNKKNIKGGMYPKLTGAIDCLEKGVKNAHIVDGRVPHSVLIELLTDKGVGTWISK